MIDDVSPGPPGMNPPGLGRALSALAAYLLLQVAVAGIGAAVIIISGPPDVSMHITTSALWQPMVVAAVSLSSIGAFLLVHRQWRRWWRLETLPGLGFTPCRSPALLAGVALGLLIPLLGGRLTLWLAGGHAIEQGISDAASGMAMPMRVVLAVAAVTLAPVAEEALFRGALLSALSRRMHVLWAVLLSSLLFALLHLPDLGWHVYALPALMLLGIGCAWLRIRNGSIYPAIALHMTNNLLAIAVWFVAVH